jgi:hypothetical protein
MGREIRLKNGGGGLLDWCMNKARVGTPEYRIRLMSFPQGGRNEMQIVNG